MKKGQAEHLLLDEEIRELKAIYKRKKVTTNDTKLVEKIYKRMNPKYNAVCETCLDALAAEVRGLIAYAEKQIGKRIHQFEETAPKVEEKITVEEKSGIETNLAEKEDKVIATSSSQHDKIELNHEGIAGLSNKDLIKYVFQETGVELSEHADRSELLATADDLLDHAEKVKKEEKKLPEDEKIELPKRGFNVMKSDLIYKYVKQETGGKLAEGLKRQELIEAAKTALKYHSDQ